MMHALESLATWILMMAVVVSGQKLRSSAKPSRQSSGLQLECLGNIMKLSLDKSLAVGNQLEIDAINGTEFIPLTPGLAAQCGHSMESDPWGNTKIYSSLLGCYVENKMDRPTEFKVGLLLRMYGDPQLGQKTYDATTTCSASFASREILCDRNYMEISTGLPWPQLPVRTLATDDLQDDSWYDAVHEIAGAQALFQVTFFTPELRTLTLLEAQLAGYGVLLSPSRLVVRSPYNTAETYSLEVAGVPMQVVSMANYYKPAHGVHIVESKAACPTGGVIFTEEVITWHVPLRANPVIDGDVRILEMHMGIDGKRLDRTKMAARRYSLSATESHIIVELPVGSPDGYYKSHAPDYQYHISFTIEPMLELLWKGDEPLSDTRYKVLFPITTPLMPRPPQVTDNTVHEQRVFDVLLGTFLHDVELVNITFSTGILSVAECNARGFNIQEHRLPNDMKTFSLTVPFSDGVVLKHNPEPLVTVYSLPLTYGLLVLPERTPFPYSATLEASLKDVVLPIVSGTCDQENFYVTVKYGSHGTNIEVKLGIRDLTLELAEGYSLMRNSTHFSLVIPYTSMDSTFEFFQSTTIQARIDLLLLDPINNWKLTDFSLMCNFPFTTAECYSNGTMTGLAVKVESVPNMIPSQLTLRDGSCRPYLSNERFAFFLFQVDTCGTTREFYDNGFMVYENEITMYRSSSKGRSKTSRVDPEYRQTISCMYRLEDSETMVFRTRPRMSEPKAEVGQGQLVVQMRVAQDASYSLFHQAEDYPLVQFLRRPVYFEVQLIESTDPQMALVLENCWATAHENRTSLPSWDLIVDSCANLEDRYTTLLLPVEADARVLIPAHVKRFSVKMFAFASEEAVLNYQIFFHCDAVICNTNNPSQGICHGQCARPTRTSGLKRGRRSADSQLQEQISSGPILLFDQRRILF